MKMKNGQIATIAILCLVGLCVIAAGTGLWLLGTYNGLVNIDEEVASKWGSFEVNRQMAIHNSEDIDIFNARVVQVGSSKGIVIPSQIMKGNNWKKGQKLRVWVRVQ